MHYKQQLPVRARLKFKARAEVLETCQDRAKNIQVAHFDSGEDGITNFQLSMTQQLLNHLLV